MNAESEYYLPSDADWWQAHGDEQAKWENDMALKMKAASGGDGDYELCPPGLYRAVCTRLITLGSHMTKRGLKPKVLVGWEVDKRMSDNRPFLVQSQYTLSLHPESRLRQMLEQWQGKKYREGEDIDLAAIVGRPCIINIRHQEVGDKTYANVDAVMPAQGDALQPEGNQIVFDIDTPNMQAFSLLSERLQEKIQSSPEWGTGAQTMPTFAGRPAAQAPQAPQELPNDFDDDIPF